MIERIKPEVSKCRIAGYFAVLLFAVLFAIMLNASSAKAAAGDIDSGKYNGVPWRLTSNLELIFGETGKKYDLDEIEIAKDIFRGSKVKKVSFLGTVSINYASSMFSGCSALKTLNLSGLDTSNVTYMNWMFSGCSALKTLNLSGLDTSNVTYMGDMFSDCSALTSVNLSGLDTSNVTYMGDMFSDCSALTSVNLRGLDTSKVEDMRGMFWNCSALKTLNLSGLDTSSVTNMNWMFSGCSSLTSINLSGLNTSNVTYMGDMFSNCSALTSVNLIGLDTSKADTMGFFGGCRIRQIGLGTKTLLDDDSYGPWKRVKRVNGSSANGPTIKKLSDYLGTAPGWYVMINLTNPLKVKGNTVKIKYKKLKKKTMTIKRAKAIKVSKAQGKVTYKLASVKKSKFKKFFKVKKNGNITVKKKLKKGSYKLKIKVTAAGNVQYKKATKTATVRIKVK